MIVSSVWKTKYGEVIANEQGKCALKFIVEFSGGSFDSQVLSFINIYILIPRPSVAVPDRRVLFQRWGEGEGV